MGGTLAVVGAGAWGQNLVRNFHAIGALAAICEPAPDRRAALAAQYPTCPVVDHVDAVFENAAIGAVAIATPAESHAALVRRALNAGKDVFVEKPLCLTVTEGEALVQLAKQQGRILMVGHLLWYHPAVIRLKQLVDSGELGRVQYVYSNRLNLGRIRREENILWSFAPHDISVILGLVNETPDAVQAQGGNYLHPSIADVTVSLLSFPSGVKAHVFVSWLHPFKEQKLVVVGDRKMAVFDAIEPTPRLILYPHSIEWKHQVPVVNKAEGHEVAFESGEPLRAECQHFVDCVRTRARPRTDGEEGLRVLAVLQRCQEALESRSPAPARPAPLPARPYFVHESAFIDSDVEIGEGTTIWHVSHIMRGSRIGRKCRIGQNVVVGPRATVCDGVKIQNNVSVYEGVTLEDDVFCGPSMVFTNVTNPRSEIARMNELKPTLVKRGATLGANSTIVCGNTVGCYAFVGAGAVVTRNVPDYALVLGNPARIVGWMCACGVRLTVDEGEATCTGCNRKYRRGPDGVHPVDEERG